jgi:GH24 family phage-related lysozyme (muramidase)
MNYQQASEVRGRGLLGNITDNLVSGQSIGKSFGRGISDTFKAKAVGIKEKFDPIRIAQKMTGNLGGALVGRLFGRKKEDMQHFLGGQYGSSARDDGFGNVSTAFFSTVTAPRKLQSGDSVTDVASKLFAFMEKSRDEKNEQYELKRDFEEESLAEDEMRHKKLLKAIEDTKKIPEEEKEKPKKEEKKKEEPKKEESKKGEPAKGEPAKGEPAKGEPAKGEPSKIAEPKNPPPEKTPVKIAKPTIQTKPPPTTTPVTPAAPAATSAGVSTAVKVAGAGVAVAASGAALAKIRGHEGYVQHAYYDPKRDASGKVLEEHYSVGYGHQITSDEIKKGYIEISGKKIPVVGELGKDTVISKEDADALSTKEYKKYEDSAKKITNFSKLNANAQTAFIDMTYNMGVGWFSPQKWPSLHNALQQLDMDAAAQSIVNSKYYKDTGKRAQENVMLIKNGLNTTKEVPNQIDVGQKLNETSIQNKDIKQQAGTTVMINKSQNTIIQSGSKQQPQVITPPTNPDKPMIME